MKIETLARKMYEAYCASSGNKNFRGEPCPGWVELPALIQKHWNAAAFEAKLLVRTSRCVEIKYQASEAGVDWKEVDFDDLVVGDVFRMFEPDGSLVDGQAEVRVTERIADSVRVNDGKPNDHDKELREQLVYLEVQIDAIEASDLGGGEKEQATRKMKHRHELLRLALETKSNR